MPPILNIEPPVCAGDEDAAALCLEEDTATRSAALIPEIISVF